MDGLWPIPARAIDDASYRAPQNEGLSDMRLLAFGALMALAVAPEALAQDPRDVPVERDLQRMDRIDRRLGRDGIRRVDPNVTPDNPDGVVGFDGPPFNDGDRGVIDDGPLPPGSPADLDDD